MNDALTVFRKEMLEIVGDRHSFRGAFLQASIAILLTGIVVPAMDASVWTNVTTAMMLYVVFPSTLAATVAADAFAGESERLTLETLLATPLSDRSIFIGKTAVAVTFVVLISTAALAAGIITATARGLLHLPLPWLLFVGVEGGALAGALFTASVAVAISVRVPVVRSTQQMGAFMTYVVAGLAVTAMRYLSVRLSWELIIKADFVVLAIGLAGMMIGMWLFRRDRFFDQR